MGAIRALAAVPGFIISHLVTYGHVYDSLMSNYVNRVLYDLRQPILTGGGMEKRPEYQIANKGDDIILEQNIPNPFEDETEISFVLFEECPIKLIITNTLGQVITEKLEVVK
jgi:hypothetical protein